MTRFLLSQFGLEGDDLYAVAGPVISPYSTFLALTVNQGDSLRNLERMAKLGWIGAYGFYEAADYQESLREPKLVREWMAHHQGMTLLALANVLFDGAIHRWFHADLRVQRAAHLREVDSQRPLDQDEVAGAQA